MSVTDPHSEPSQPQGPYPPQQLPPAPPVSPAPYSPAPYGQQPVYLVQQQRPTSGLAVASMVLSIIGLVTGCCSFGVFSILAVIFGHVAMKETKTGIKGGHGMAVAGLVMGYIITGPAIVWSVMTIVGGGIGAVTGGINPSPTP